MKFNKVNDFLANIQPVEENIVLNGADVMQNIVMSEISDISRLSRISSFLIDDLSKDMKKLSRKEKQLFWRDVEAVNARKEDFVFKMAQEANKNGMIQKILNMSEKTEKVISENGEIIESSITEEKRNQLSALLVDLLNDRTRK